MSARLTRRALLGAGCGIGSALFIREDVGGLTTAGQSQKTKEKSVETEKMPDRLKVAVVQFRSSRDLDENVRRHTDYIRRCAKEGAQVVVFPECSITGYFDDAVDKAAPEELKDAESAIAAAAKGSGIYAVAGIPTKQDGVTYNSAIVITPEGKILERYHKVQLAGEKWATAGDHLSVFPIAGVPCSIIICHDERYPELVRLPVIAGARVVFYVSSESGIKEERKIAPYRAQIMARAVENNVYIAQANTPADKQTLEGSHGQSRLIAPDGNIIAEASIFEEEVISTTFDLTKATGKLAERSLSCELLGDWWRDGAAKVKRIGM